MTDTIFALSSGAPPAAIAIVRISGPRADAALEAIAGKLSPARTAVLATLRCDGKVLDRALVLRFPGPDSATGESVAELHLHGGRAVVAAVMAALASLDGLRAAEPGEFTRRAFENGRIDLAEAEGLADLLAAETEAQRRSALAMAGGALSRQVEWWRHRLLAAAAGVEAALDFSDEDDVGASPEPGWAGDVRALAADMRAALARPPVERLRDGVRIVIAGPPNAGKSSLLNALVDRELAIVSALPGTTRDVIEAPIAVCGLPILLVDTAGLRESSDPVEQIGIERARASVSAADLILWLGDPADAPPGSLRTHSKSDLTPAPSGADVDATVSAVTGQGLSELIDLLVARARALLPREDEAALNARHRDLIGECLSSLEEAQRSDDMLIAAEALRRARTALDRITGRSGVEDMLDALFGRFCIGK